MTSNCEGKTKRMMLLYKWSMCSFKGHLRTLHLNWFYLKMNKNVDYQVCTLPSVFSIQMVTDRHHCANIHIRITYSTLLLQSHLATWHYSSADITTNMRMLNPTIWARVFLCKERQLRRLSWTIFKQTRTEPSKRHFLHRLHLSHMTSR